MGVRGDWGRGKLFEEREYSLLSRSFVVKERRGKGPKLAQKVRSRENSFFFCIDMVKITKRFYVSNDPGKMEKLMKPETEGRKAGALSLERM